MKQTPHEPYQDPSLRCCFSMKAWPRLRALAILAALCWGYLCWKSARDVMHAEVHST